MLDINKLSKEYKVRKLEAEDSLTILELEKGNPFYFEYCQPEPTIDGVMDDMKALPPGKSMCDKHYIGFFRKKA